MLAVTVYLNANSNATAHVFVLVQKGLLLKQISHEMDLLIGMRVSKAEAKQ